MRSMPSLIRSLSLGSFLAAYQIEVRAQTGGRSTRGFLILEDPDVRGKDHKRSVLAIKRSSGSWDNFERSCDGQGG